MKTGNRGDKRGRRVRSSFPEWRAKEMAENRQEMAQVSQGPPKAFKAAQNGFMLLLLFLYLYIFTFCTGKIHVKIC